MANLFYSEDKVSEIRDRSSILQVVSDYVKLHKTGKNYRGLCPFHAEKTPSFMVNEEKQIFHCFGCGEGGDVFTFLMKVAHFSFPEAVEELAKRYGILLTPQPFSPQRRKEAGRREVLFQINQMAMEYFHDLLLHAKAGEGARRYLSNRRVSKEIWEEYRLGFSLESWNGLVQYLREKKVDLELARELGLVLPRKQEGWYDVFRGRVIFPILDIHQRPVGFGGRVLNGGLPKYINSAESIIYHKGEALYGLHAARPAISEMDCVVIVEGYFDLLALHQVGFKHSVASSGTALTSQHIRTLRRYTQNIVTLFDGDQAGIQATTRCLPLFLEEGIWAKAVLLPEGEDPDLFLRNRDVKVFRKEVAEAVPLFDFFLDTLMRAHDMKSIEGRVSVAEEAVAMLRKVSGEIRRSVYVKALAERVGVQETVLYKMLGSPSNGHRKEEKRESRAGEKRTYPKPEEMLIRLMALYPELISKVPREGIGKEFEHPILKRMAEHLEDLYQSRGAFDLAEALAGLGDDLRDALRAICVREEGLDEGDREKILADCIRNIRGRKAKRYREELLRRIKEAERRQGFEEVESLLLERQELEKGRDQPLERR